MRVANTTVDGRFGEIGDAPKRVGYAPPSQMLAAAYIGRFGARAIADPVVTFDKDAAHAALAKLDCGGKTNRSGTNNHDVRFHIDQCAHMPASQFRVSASRCGLVLDSASSRRRGWIFVES
jgi:hypothetical protein